MRHAKVCAAAFTVWNNNNIRFFTMRARVCVCVVCARTPYIPNISDKIKQLFKKDS